MSPAPDYLATILCPITARHPDGDFPKALTDALRIGHTNFGGPVIPTVHRSFFWAQRVPGGQFSLEEYPSFTRVEEERSLDPRAARVLATLVSKLPGLALTILLREPTIRVRITYLTNNNYPWGIISRGGVVAFETYIGQWLLITEHTATLAPRDSFPHMLLSLQYLSPNLTRSIGRPPHWAPKAHINTLNPAELERFTWTKVEGAAGDEAFIWAGNPYEPLVYWTEVDGHQKVHSSFDEALRTLNGESDDE